MKWNEIFTFHFFHFTLMLLENWQLPFLKKKLWKNFVHVIGFQAKKIALKNDLSTQSYKNSFMAYFQKISLFCKICDFHCLCKICCGSVKSFSLWFLQSSHVRKVVWVVAKFRNCFGEFSERFFTKVFFHFSQIQLYFFTSLLNQQMIFHKIFRNLNNSRLMCSDKKKH